jgi:DNA-binding MarR family transcriptional regulator
VSELDPVIHPEARLRLVIALAGLPPGQDMAFTALQQAVGLTVGNLSSHLAKLEGAGYIEVAKSIEGRRPATRIKLSAAGWEALGRYLDRLNQLLDSLP